MQSYARMLQSHAVPKPFRGHFYMSCFTHLLHCKKYVARKAIVNSHSFWFHRKIWNIWYDTTLFHYCHCPQKGLDHKLEAKTQKLRRITHFAISCHSKNFSWQKSFVRNDFLYTKVSPEFGSKLDWWVTLNSGQNFPDPQMYLCSMLWVFPFNIYSQHSLTWFWGKIKVSPYLN